MDWSLWVIPIVLTKLIIYCAFAAAIGGSVMAFVAANNQQVKAKIHRYIQKLSALALAATCIYFFAQVGSFAEAGLMGMFEQTFVTVIWNSGIGDATLFRLLGFLLVIVASWSIIKLVKGKLLATLLMLSGMVCLVKSFTTMGHVAELDWTLQLALYVHIAMVAWWIGALWPLYLACRHFEAVELHSLMHRFAQHAMYVIISLIVAGSVIGLQLVGSFDNLFNTSYGQMLIAKLVFVSGILLLAAWHKWRLVPAILTDLQGKNELAKSIQLEMILAAAIFLVTALLTTLMGPSH